MRVISKPTLIKFFEKPEYADSTDPLLSWHAHALKASWNGPAQVKADFGTASILKNGRVVFNIGGNKYRLVTHINYAYGIVFIKFIGTHAQYDKIDAQTIEVE